MAWREFKKGKENKSDVQQFALDVEDALFDLHRRLADGAYRHAQYTSFYLHDPKLRHIHKACVRDRIVHHAVVRVIEPIFERTFIFDSYSSRKNKGTHKAVRRFQDFAWILSRNITRVVWDLKCDIRKFFDSVGHDILIHLIQKKIPDEKAIQLIKEIVHSFSAGAERGIPLGNVTSQLFSNIYLDALDQFIKRKAGVTHYIRYADDFVIISEEKPYVEELISVIDQFLASNLKLQLHPHKLSVRKWHQGVDFLGYINFPHYAILRTKTKKRMISGIRKKYQMTQSKIISEESFMQSMHSYLGILKHCRGHAIARRIRG